MRTSQQLSAAWLAPVNASPGRSLPRSIGQELRLLQPLLKKAMIPLMQPLQVPRAGASGLHLQPYAMAQRVGYIHLVGQAKGDRLEVHTGKGTVCLSPTELGEFVSQFPRLECVFLSGCATLALVEELLRRDVPAILATQSQVHSTQNLAVARTFYQRLAEGDSLLDAFSAVKFLHSQTLSYKIRYDLETDRMVWGRRPEHQQAVLPWGLYYLGEHTQRLRTKPTIRTTLRYAPRMDLRQRLTTLGYALGITGLGLFITALVLRWQAPEVLTLLHAF